MDKQPKIGLALGSGGPKGLAHIGVIKVLEENNIPIDFIAGSSIGAMVGGFYAGTKDIKQVEKIANDVDWKLIFSLLDPSFQQGLLGGEKVKNFIENYLNGINFENLKIPLSVITTDIKTGESVSINKGGVASAIRTSISFPLVFKPVKRAGRLLADGGLSLPIPVEIVRKMGAELTIAVNLDADYFINGNNGNANFGFYKIANNSINLLRHHLASYNIQNADVVIAPQSGNLHWNNFLGGKNIISAGEKAAKQVLPQLKKLMSQKSKGE
ncbi:MAG: patatin-like phospholipase family protein [Candidatus Pacebacteria bacterium]|nr:patatin-like phospholipase family protein [Candidatus Paceibacterota bacterium]